MNQIAVIRHELTAMSGQFEAALPAHIPVERFSRVVQTAIANEPKLQTCNRRSLWNAAVRAAQDGLLPDGREGAIVPFKNEATWMPMVAGLLKKVRNSGELKSITAMVVYAGDTFRHWVDDEGEHVHFEAGDKRDKDTVRRVFAVASTKDGGRYVEVMDMDDIDKVRAVSRAKSGPWFDWEHEMMRKTVIRRLAKRLPMSTDLDDLIRRDDDLYDFEGAGDRQVKQQPQGLANRMQALTDETEVEDAEEVPFPGDPIDYKSLLERAADNGVEAINAAWDAVPDEAQAECEPFLDDLKKRAAEVDAGKATS